MTQATEQDRLVEIARISHDLIVGLQDPSGAYPASPTFSAYRGYSWLRDGAFIAEGISRYGDIESADRFHDWITARLSERRTQVDELIARRRAGSTPEAADMLPTRFPIEDPSSADTWWNFQTDGYGTWLWAVVAHARRHRLPLARWQPGIEVAVDYAAAFWDVPCYDWWEENVDQRHGSTLGALYGGLHAAAEAGLLEPAREAAASEAAERIRELVLAGAVGGEPRHLTKWIGSEAVDASLLSSIVPFGLLRPDDSIAMSTVAEVERQLDVGGGVHRYAADVFFGGGQWLLLSCLLGWNEVAAGRTEDAWRHLRWVASHLDSSGEFPEQVPDHLLHPEHRQHWIDQWGPVATPLLWSHGMYLILADELGLLAR